MPKFAHEEHLKQGEGRTLGTGPSGSHTDPTGPTGAGRSKSGGSHLAQGEGGARSMKATGSHTQPHPSLTDMTSDKQGGTKRGHDRTNPTAGKSKSGSKFAQHPNNRRGK